MASSYNPPLIRNKPRQQRFWKTNEEHYWDQTRSCGHKHLLPSWKSVGSAEEARSAWQLTKVWRLIFFSFLSSVSSTLNKIYKLGKGLPPFLCAYLQISPDSFFTFGFGTGQLLPQHFLPHVDSLKGLLDVKEILLECRNKEFQLMNSI